MQDFILTHYLWFKSFHLVAVIAWMAGLLYLPRLFVYHANAAKNSDVSETFKVMEMRLYRFIMQPAMGLTWLFGGLMLYANHEAIMAMGWMHAKLTLVIAMTGLHHIFGSWRKKFAADANTKSPKFYKIWNEAPTVLMIAIVVLVIVKPF
jgi:putative membrane protein